MAMLEKLENRSRAVVGVIYENPEFELPEMQGVRVQREQVPPEWEFLMQLVSRRTGVEMQSSELQEQLFQDWLQWHQEMGVIFVEDIDRYRSKIGFQNVYFIYVEDIYIHRSKIGSQNMNFIYIADNYELLSILDTYLLIMQNQCLFRIAELGIPAVTNTPDRVIEPLVSYIKVMAQLAEILEKETQFNLFLDYLHKGYGIFTKEKLEIMKS